jgi:hypothetical protein
MKRPDVARQSEQSNTVVVKERRFKIRKVIKWALIIIGSILGIYLIYRAGKWIIAKMGGALKGAGSAMGSVGSSLTGGLAGISSSFKDIPNSFGQILDPIKTFMPTSQIFPVNIPNASKIVPEVPKIKIPKIKMPKLF